MADSAPRDTNGDVARVRALVERLQANATTYESLAQKTLNARARALLERLMTEERARVVEATSILQLVESPAAALEPQTARPPPYSPVEPNTILYALPAPPARTPFGLTVGALRGRPEGSR